MGGVRELLIGNWRNKAVAMVFAITIWYVAYQSEFRPAPIKFLVQLQSVSDDWVILQKTAPGPAGKEVPFLGEVTLHVSGSRKQIDTLQRDLPSQRVDIPVEFDGSNGDTPAVTHYFNERQLEFLRFSLIDIDRFVPPFVKVVLDRKVSRDVKVDVVPPSLPGREVVVDKVDPPAVRLVGPSSVLAKVQAVAEANLSGADTEFHGKVALRIVPETIDGVRTESLLTGERLGEVTVDLRARVREDTLARDAVRVRFLVPPVPFFYRIEFEESTIPIVFRGPEAEIALLREKVDKPDFFVAFNVPLTELRPDREHTSTFTEDQLHLVGFSQSVQKLQHERRAAEGKGAWAYTILPAAATDEP